MSDRPRRRDRTGLALGSEVLLIGAASGVPDKQRAHGAPPEGWPDRAAGRGRPGHRAAPDLPERRSDSTSATASPAHNGIRLWPVWEVAARRGGRRPSPYGAARLLARPNGAGFPSTGGAAATAPS